MNIVQSMLNNELGLDDRERWEVAAAYIHALFQNGRSDLLPVIRLANSLKEMIELVDPDIQMHTVQVCRSCTKVCCSNKHAYYDYMDFIFVSAVGLTPPIFGEFVAETDPCQFNTAHGCSLKRINRPFRCNQYFCDSLKTSMRSDAGGLCEELEGKIKDIEEVRKGMVEAFFGIVCKREGGCLK
jgi:hypothetical protein